MAKKQINHTESIKLELDKLMVRYAITNNKELLPKIKELSGQLDYLYYGVCQNQK